MVKGKMKAKNARKTRLKSHRPAKSGDKPDINRLAEIQRMYDEMGLGSEEERLAYRRVSPLPRKKSPYTLCWYFDERDMELDAMRRKQNDQSTECRA